MSKSMPEMSMRERAELLGISRPYMLVAKCCTGRTTRMMEEAIQLAQEGKAVYVLCGTMDHAKSLARGWSDRTCGLGIKFETPDTIGPGFDWQHMRAAGMHPNCVVLVDTWAIEKRFAAMLDMLHRWDVVED